MPSNLADWIKSLPNRPGWGGWDAVGICIYDGVQNWSQVGEGFSTAVGVWGIVREATEDDPKRVEWSVYQGDSMDPEKDGFEEPEAAMIWAEAHFPEIVTGK